MSVGEPRDSYQPGGGFKSAFDDRPSAREVLKYTLFWAAVMSARSLLAIYVGHDTAFRIVDLCMGAFLIGMGAWIILGPERFVRGPKDMRILSILVIVAGSAMATLNIHSLFFAE